MSKVIFNKADEILSNLEDDLIDIADEIKCTEGQLAAIDEEINHPETSEEDKEDLKSEFEELDNDLEDLCKEQDYLWQLQSYLAKFEVEE